MSKHTAENIVKALLCLFFAPITFGFTLVLLPYCFIKEEKAEIKTPVEVKPLAITYTPKETA